MLLPIRDGITIVRRVGGYGLLTVSVALGLRYERDLRTITFHRGAK